MNTEKLDRFVGSHDAVDLLALHGIRRVPGCRTDIVGRKQINDLDLLVLVCGDHRRHLGRPHTAGIGLSSRFKHELELGTALRTLDPKMSFDSVRSTAGTIVSSKFDTYYGNASVHDDPKRHSGFFSPPNRTRYFTTDGIRDEWKLNSAGRIRYKALWHCLASTLVDEAIDRMEVK